MLGLCSGCKILLLPASSTPLETLVLQPFYMLNAGLSSSVTDDGLCALAFAGCGVQLSSLFLRCVLCFACLSYCRNFDDTLEEEWWSCIPNVPVCVAVLGAVLEKEVTDDGLSALAAAGCGAHLTSLTLWGE